MTKAKAIQTSASVRAADRKRHVGVLVLGMRGGGGGTLTKVLNILGCSLPVALIGPSDGDEAGYWEAGSTAALNDEILASAGSSWNDLGPINADWRASGVRTEMVGRAVEIIREHKSLGPLFAMEDPTLCRVADLWLEATDAAGVDLRVVLMLRHPGEVAASLESRDLVAPGYGLLLWLRHALDAEHLSRGHKRAISRFDRLLHNWQDTIDGLRRGLALALPRNSQAAHAEVEQFLGREMRHQEVIADPTLGLSSTSEWLRRTFEILLAWSETGENPTDHAELNRIRTEFDNAYPAFARLLLSSEFSGDLATGSHLREQLSQQLAEAANRGEAIEQQAAEIEQLLLRAKEMASHVTALTESYETMQARVESLQAQADALRAAAARAAELDGAVESLRQRESELASRAEELEAMVLDARAEAEAEHARLVDAERERDERGIVLEEQKRLNEELMESAGTADSAAESLRQRESELASRAEELEAMVLDARAEAEAEHARLVDAERERDERGIVLEEQKRLNEELMESAGTAAKQHEEELAKLLGQLKAIGDTAQAATAASWEERERRANAEAQLEAALQDMQELAEKRSELEGRLRATESAAVQRQEELAQLWSQLESLQTAAGASAAEVAAERDRRSAAEELLAAALKDAREIAEEKGKLEGRLRIAEITRGAAEKESAQRQEELVQLWGQFGIVQSAAGASATEVTLERERRIEVEAQLTAAMRDVRGMIYEKADFEVRAKVAETELTSRREDYMRLSEQLAEAKELAARSVIEAGRERELRLARENSLAKVESVMAELRARTANLEKAPSPNAVYTEIAQLTRMLEALEMEAASAQVAREAAEQRIAGQTQEVARLTTLLSQQSSLAEGSEGRAKWLRDLTKVSECMPKWWSLMPSSWRRKREHEAYRRAGLFDAEQYLELYPDVSMAGMDPMRHYILHGMAEGRTLFR